ncbi:MerR family transcriptional regulator [Nonomuraea sp. NPDC050786]|uniref:MerR family transcriptional regulator n=1 Tax=Nonomuraea sp. NPDC050786 TaxID=3154840 RepID=UPI003411ADA8
MSDTWTIGELAEHAARALRSGAAPANGRVRDVPGERLIRWYTTIGLVDPPLTRRGRIAQYGRRHLLQLVAVKRLQAAGHSIAQIQAALTGATDRMLEATAGLAPAPGSPDGPSHSSPGPMTSSDALGPDIAVGPGATPRPAAAPRPDTTPRADAAPSTGGAAWLEDALHGEAPLRHGPAAAYHARPEADATHDGTGATHADPRRDTRAAHDGAGPGTDARTDDAGAATGTDAERGSAAGKHSTVERRDAQHGATERRATERDTAQPDAPDPSAAQRDTTQPDAPERSAAQPDPAQPDATERSAAELDAMWADDDVAQATTGAEYPGDGAARAGGEHTRGRFWADRHGQAAARAPGAAGQGTTGQGTTGQGTTGQGTTGPWAPGQGAAHEGPAAPVVTGVRLADGVRLVLDAGRVPSEEDVQAVLAAAAPLLAVLEERELR